MFVLVTTVRLDHEAAAINKLEALSHTFHIDSSIRFRVGGNSMENDSIAKLAKEKVCLPPPYP